MEGPGMLADEAAPLAESLPGLGLNADLLSLFSRIEREHPTAAATAVTAEVDRVLGRPPRPPTLSASANGWKRAQAETGAPNRSAFEWYQSINKRLPPVMDHERAVRAAIAVEVGLLAEERLAS